MKKTIILLMVLLIMTLFITACAQNDIIFSPSPGFFDEEVTVELQTPNTETEVDVYYTLDGTDPTESSTLYTEPIEIASGKVTIKAIITGDTNVYQGEYGIANYGLDFVLGNQDKEPVARSDFEEEGKYLHIEFSADWCPHCHNQASITTEAHETLIDDGYNIDSIVVISENGEYGSDIDTITLDEWSYNYNLPYVLGDDLRKTLSAYSNEYLTETSLGFPFNVLIKYETGQWEYADDWCGGYSTADALVSRLSSFMD
jgi:thiol-disulfide isomerase/thioredoxin